MKIEKIFRIKLARIHDDGTEEIIGYFKDQIDAEYALDGLKEMFDDCEFKIIGGE